VALSAARLADFMAADLSALDLLVVQIDGLHLGDDLVLVAAIGSTVKATSIRWRWWKGQPERRNGSGPAGQPGLARARPDSARLFIRRRRESVVGSDPPHFGSAAAIQRCQIHKARNIMERLPKEHHAATRRVLRQAWELDDADKAEKLIRNLARRLDQQWPGVAARLLEGLDEILTVVRFEAAEGAASIARLYQHRREHDGHHSPRHAQRPTLAGCRMALRWVAAGMIEANKGFRRLKAHKQLSVLRAALQAHHDRMTIKPLPTHEGRVTFTPATSTRCSSTAIGTSPGANETAADRQTLCACCLQQLSVVTIIEILFLLILLQHYRNLFRATICRHSCASTGKLVSDEVVSWHRVYDRAPLSASSSPRLYGASGRGVAATKPSFTINAPLKLDHARHALRIVARGAGKKTWSRPSRLVGQRAIAVRHATPPRC